MLKDREERNLYRRSESPYWWVKFIHMKRVYRRSTGCLDFEAAKRAKAAVIDLVVSRELHEPAWRAHVALHENDPESWLRRTHRRICAKSVKKRWPGAMTLHELTNLMIRSGGKCALTGLAFAEHIKPKAGRDPYAISIDRIDSSLGYTAENSRLILLGVNIALQQWGSRDMLKIAAALLIRSKIDDILDTAVPRGKEKKP